MKDKQPFMQGDSIWQRVISKMPHDQIVLKKREAYFPENHSDKVAVLIDGLMKVFIADAMGEERFMWLVEPCALIQWTEKHAFSHQLVAVKTTVLFTVRKTLFLSQIQSSPMLFDKYIESIYQKYAYCIEKLIVTDVHNSQFKVYSFLLHLAYRYGKEKDDGIMIDNILTRQDISSITGVHRTNIIKYLTQLEQTKIIEKDHKRICIKDLKALENLVQSLDII